ncbi:MAG: hypothetical protein KZY55_08105 [Paeniclostridium sp.]|nr:hypothetical protein [Paeniclostridium sp.]MBW4862700.1 hypothetical protein [Paeniclostridium sp.]MBW4874013.1 hypothetical protein [Paeniclostridium sp.]
MASQEFILKRRDDLKNFFLNSQDKQISRSDILKFYKNKYPSKSSDSTISRDLKNIGAICNKKNNSYYLKEVKQLNHIKLSIHKYLSKCIIFKPVKLSTTIDILDNDINPSLEYYVITIKCKNSKHDEYVYEKLCTAIKKLINFSSLYEKHKYIDLKFYSNSILFLFNDNCNMKNFYLELNNLKQFKQI